MCDDKNCVLSACAKDHGPCLQMNASTSLKTSMSSDLDTATDFAAGGSPTEDLAWMGLFQGRNTSFAREVAEVVSSKYYATLAKFIIF